jgi:selenocysteine lyase/cysteine desulfurase
MALTERLLNGLRSVSKVKVYGHGSSTVPHIGVVSFNIKGFTSHEAASILDASFGVQARAGLHCAPGAHRYLGTFDSGGTIRFSVGPMTSTSEIDAAVDAVKGLCE